MLPQSFHLSQGNDRLQYIKRHKVNLKFENKLHEYFFVDVKNNRVECFAYCRKNFAFIYGSKRIAEEILVEKSA